ncbi:Unknown protein sequence [Pseudomonas syringae pv. syringae]|nr:Unknown protein sequence [Pseudomonas syringae pv. syringae]
MLLRASGLKKNCPARAKFWSCVNNIDQQSWPMLEAVGVT